MINVIKNLQIQQTGINISNQFMNKRNIPAHYVIIKQQDRIVLHLIKNQFIKVSSINVPSVDLKHQPIVFLMHIFSQNIKERNISVNLVIKNMQIHQLCGFIINQFMKVLHIIVIFASQHSNINPIYHNTSNLFISKKPINVNYVIIKQHKMVVYPYMSKMFIKRVRL